MNIQRAFRQFRRSIGLEPMGVSDFVMPAIGILAVGMLAGAGVALLFAPTTGKKLREEVEHKLSEFRSRLMLQQGETNGGRAGQRNNLTPQSEPFSRG